MRDTERKLFPSSGTIAPPVTLFSLLTLLPSVQTSSWRAIFAFSVILISLLQSVLSVVRMPEAGRQIIYGILIIAMLLLYERERAEQ